MYVIRGTNGLAINPRTSATTCSVYARVMCIHISLDTAREADDNRRNQKAETARPTVLPHIHSRRFRSDSFAFHVLMGHAGKQFYPRRTAAVTETNRANIREINLLTGRRKVRRRLSTVVRYHREKSQLSG